MPPLEQAWGGTFITLGGLTQRLLKRQLPGKVPGLAYVVYS